MTVKLLLYILVMALTTYLIRMLPFTLFRKKIKNPFLKSFFYYIPYAVLGAMTIPWIFYSTGSFVGAAAGTVCAFVLAYFERSLIVVALSSCAVAYVTQLIFSLT
ncbi:MAG: AzlD domain-containing protein [Ruminococcaceae bacterium]|nr:AzlD domain-containing protein [Oscillospiraceae bacterium]